MREAFARAPCHLVMPQPDGITDSPDFHGFQDEIVARVLAAIAGRDGGPPCRNMIGMLERVVRSTDRSGERHDPAAQ
jgi:hypothetical protein